jgi:hypothetical protein
MSKGCAIDSRRAACKGVRIAGLHCTAIPSYQTTYSAATARFFSIHFTVSAAFLPAMNAWSEL